MNKQFVFGTIFAASLALFGKSMYELGKEDGKMKERNVWMTVIEVLDISEKKGKES